MSQTCHSCGQTIQETHREHLNKSKLTMLQAAAKLVIETNRNDFKKKDVGDFAGNPSHYNNFQKLRYHGLITQVKVNGERVRDRWLITRNAWSFLRGEIELPKYVDVRNNRIVERATTTIGVKDVYRGADIMATTFEYFDHETGEPIGIRPFSGQKAQMSLI